MKSKITIVARLLTGLIFFAGGIAGLFELVPPPDDLPEKLQTFNAGLMASGYFMTLLKVTEVICGLLLLSGFFVPLALVVLAPIVINIFLVHAFLAPDGLVLGLTLGALLIYLSFFAEPYSKTIISLFKMK